MRSSHVSPGRHSLFGFKTMVVSAMPIGAESVGVVERPILPKTLTTSGTSLIFRSIDWSALPAAVIDMPGGAVGM